MHGYGISHLRMHLQYSKPNFKNISLLNYTDTTLFLKTNVFLD